MYMENWKVNRLLPAGSEEIEYNESRLAAATARRKEMAKEIGAASAEWLASTAGGELMGRMMRTLACSPAQHGSTSQDVRVRVAHSADLRILKVFMGANYAHFKAHVQQWLHLEQCATGFMISGQGNCYDIMPRWVVVQRVAADARTPEAVRATITKLVAEGRWQEASHEFHDRCESWEAWCDRWGPLQAEIVGLWLDDVLS